jgi:hypothetical protein
MNDTYEARRERIHEVLRYVFMDIRNLALKGANRQLADLTEAIELAPEFLIRRDDRDFDRTKGGLEEYAEKYPGLSSRLISLLDAGRESQTPELSKAG